MAAPLGGVGTVGRRREVWGDGWGGGGGGEFFSSKNQRRLFFAES